MGFKSKLFTAIVSCLTSIVVQSFGELLVLRHPTNDKLSDQKLTCFAENDDAALIWNRNFDIVPDSPTDFYPRRSRPKNISECVISMYSGQCLARWQSISGWKVVKSTARPMGPVLDFRWEDFNEFTSETHIRDSEYQYVGEVKRSSGSVAFSARGQTDLHVFLCENKILTTGSYFWIIIGGWEGTKSVIRFCEQRIPGAKAPSWGDGCVEIE